MNYLKLYIKLIRKAQRRDPKELEGVYTEKHHIFPKSIFGPNNIMVRLTYKEHIVAHHLILKACIKRYGLKHNHTIKMNYALSWFMQYEQKADIVDAVGIAKRIKSIKRPPLTHSKASVKKFSGSNHGLYDHTKRCWYNLESGALEEWVTTDNLIKKYGLNSAHAHAVAKGKELRYRGWVLIDLAKPGKSSEELLLLASRKVLDLTLKGQKENLYNWYNEHHKTILLKKPLEYIEAGYSVKMRNLKSLVKGKTKKSHGWIILDQEITHNECLYQLGSRLAAEYDYRFDNVLRDWVNIKSQLKEDQKTTWYISQKYGLSIKDLYQVTSLKRASYKGWKISDTTEHKC